MLQPLKHVVDDRLDDHQIHDRRNQWKDDLENPDVRHGDKAERAEAQTKERVLVLPHALQCAERPTETLLGETAHRVGRFRPRDRSLFVTDLVTEPPHAQR